MDYSEDSSDELESEGVSGSESGAKNSSPNNTSG